MSDQGADTLMNRDERTIFSSVLLEAARKLLASDNRSWEIAGDQIEPLDLSGTLVASIGLSNADGLRGKLVLIAQPEFYRSVYPRGFHHGELSDAAIADWASELANQLLGRIKNLLSAHGLDFSLSIPTVIGGDRVRLLCRDSHSCLEHSVRIDGHQVDLLLEVAHSGGRKIISGDAGPVAAASEGSALLF